MADDTIVTWLSDTALTASEPALQTAATHLLLLRFAQIRQGGKTAEAIRPMRGRALVTLLS